MPKKHESPSQPLAARAWRLLRLALLCKGSAIKRRLVSNLHLAINHLKSLCSYTDQHHHPYRLHYSEHELSFEDTPTFRFKKYWRQPLFPCIDPPLVSFGDDDDDSDNDSDLNRSKEAMDGESCDIGDEIEGDRGSIDVKAEEFIRRFYKEMKLQRQISCLRYNEMLYRGMS